MTPKQWSFYVEADGLFLPIVMTLPNSAARDANTPPGAIAIEGAHDYLCQRVDLATGQIVDYQPPEPAATQWATWAWADTVRRWRPVPTLAALQRAANEPLLAQLAELDAKLVRPAGEITEALALGQAVPAASAARLSAINAEKSALRQHLIAIAAATTTAELDQAVQAASTPGSA
jgi:hypothetical protein